MKSCGFPGCRISGGASILLVLLEAIAIAQTPANSAPIANTTTNSSRPNGPGGFGFGRTAPLPAGVKAERNIPYVEKGHRNQVLDIFLPERTSEKPLPLMI